MCNPFPPISKYLKYILGKAARSPLADTWPTSQPVSVQLWREFVAGHAGRNGMAPAVCHLQKNESYDIGHRDALGYHLDMTWICCSAKTRERHQRALPALPGREREREQCVCVLSPLIVMRVRVCKLKSVVNFTCLPGELVVHASTNPTMRLACDTDITGEVQWRTNSNVFRTVEHVSMSGCCRYRYIISLLHQDGYLGTLKAMTTSSLIKI
jgi:hypothetical protein